MVFLEATSASLQHTCTSSYPHGHHPVVGVFDRLGGGAIVELAVPYVWTQGGHMRPAQVLLEGSLTGKTTCRLNIDYGTVIVSPIMNVPAPNAPRGAVHWTQRGRFSVGLEAADLMANNVSHFALSLFPIKNGSNSTRSQSARQSALRQMSRVSMAEYRLFWLRDQVHVYDRVPPSQSSFLLAGAKCLYEETSSGRIQPQSRVAERLGWGQPYIRPAVLSRFTTYQDVLDMPPLSRNAWETSADYKSYLALRRVAREIQRINVEYSMRLFGIAILMGTKQPQCLLSLLPDDLVLRILGLVHGHYNRSEGENWNVIY